MYAPSIRDIVFCNLGPIYFVGKTFDKVLFGGAVVAIPINFFIFGVAHHTGEVGMQLLSILNIALVSTQFLKGDKKQ